MKILYRIFSIIFSISKTDNMGQEDFFLREIEKIGVLLKALIAKLISDHENLSVSAEKGFLDTTESLLSETGIDINRLLLMTPDETESYLSSFKALNISNLEMLAELLLKLKTDEDPGKTKILMTKSLQILEKCSYLDKTYSFAREARIGEIKSLLDDDGRA